MQLHGEEKKIETKIVAYLSCTKIFPAIIVYTCLRSSYKIENICYIYHWNKYNKRKNLASISYFTITTQLQLVVKKIVSFFQKQEQQICFIILVFKMDLKLYQEQSCMCRCVLMALKWRAVGKILI